MQGPQGPQGIQGPTGLQGPQGIQGVKGDQGIQGPTGLQGPQGIQGVKGDQGIPGPTGPGGGGGVGTGGGSAWSTFPAYQTVDMSGNILNNVSSIRNGAGTVSAPSYTFVNDVSMGLYDPSTNVLGVVTSGVERMRVNNVGNVGIGTTAPRSLLDVSGQFYGRLPVFDVSATTQTLTLGVNDNSYFYLTNSSFSNIIAPATTSTGNAGTFWTFKNSTSSTLSVTLTNTLSLTSPVSIPPLNAITLTISPTSNNTLLLF